MLKAQLLTGSAVASYVTFQDIAHKCATEGMFTHDAAPPVNLSFCAVASALLVHLSHCVSMTLVRLPVDTHTGVITLC